MNEKEINKTKALLDNSIFAGVMNTYVSELKQFNFFNDYYPENKETKPVSIANFLTSICLFDTIYLEASSKVNIYKNDETNLGNEQTEWVELLLNFLPEEITDFICLLKLDEKENNGEDEIEEKISNNDIFQTSINKIEYNLEPLKEEVQKACEIAYDLVASEKTRNLIVKPDFVAPKLYTDGSYHYSKDFGRINQRNNNLLDYKLLSYAMLIHRGLFLKNIAHYEKMTYIPLLYRGEILSKISPLVSFRTRNNPFNVRLPIDANTMRPSETELLQQMNNFYYEFLNKITWVKYDDKIPFIGAAILDKSGGDMEKAFEIALEIRDKGALKKDWSELSYNLNSGNRIEYEKLLKKFKSGLEKSAIKLGYEVNNPKFNAITKLAVSWLPNNISKIVEITLELLPKNFKHWGKRYINQLIVNLKEPSQLLFVEHVNSLRKTK